MKVDAVVIRHPAAGAPHLLAQQANFSVINAGDGAHEHPTQALLDLFTLKHKLGRVEGLKIAIVGDILHSRVARSNILAFTELGAEVFLVAPATLIPAEIEALGVKVFYSLDQVIDRVDVLYLLRLQLERQKECYLPTLREYAEFYGVTSEKLKLGKEGLVVMHPGPMNRGVEIASDVADLPISFITDQVENGVAIRMALLYLLLGGGPSEVSN
jgi:aspartate carbamoyltransferase catalytic subunit